MMKFRISIILLFAFSIISYAQSAEFDYFFGEAGERAYIRLPRGQKEVKAVLYCHQNMT